MVTNELGSNVARKGAQSRLARDHERKIKASPGNIFGQPLFTERSMIYSGQVRGCGMERKSGNITALEDGTTSEF